MIISSKKARLWNNQTENDQTFYEIFLGSNILTA